MTLRAEIKALILLAIPLVVARAGHNMLGLVDTAVAGRISPEAQAVVGLANVMYFAGIIFPLGVLYGFDPLISQAIGRRDDARAKAGLTAARWVALSLSLFTVALCWVAPWFLETIKQPAELIPPIRTYLRWLSLGAPATVLFQAYAVYLTARGDTRPFLVITLIANIVNLCADLLLVRGGFGVPAMGVGGLAMSTAIVSWVQLFVVFWLMRRSGPRSATRAPWFTIDFGVMKKALHTGLPVGLQYLLEMSAFNSVAVFMGYFGAITLAAHNVAMSIVAFSFVIAVGFGAAASVRVGQAVGRGDVDGVQLAGRAAFAVGTSFAALASVCIYFGRYELSAIFTPTSDDLSMTVTLLAIGALFQFTDATQAIGFGVVRGLDDTRVPALLNLVGYYVIGLPIGLYMAFYRDGGPTWLWWGLSIGLFWVSLGLVVRFERHCRRMRLDEGT